jgi:hypothetical protein
MAAYGIDAWQGIAERLALSAPKPLLYHLRPALFAAVHEYDRDYTGSLS